MKSPEFGMPRRTVSRSGPRGAWRTAAALLRAKPARTPDAWANEQRVLPPGNAEPGPWRSDRTPYMIPIMRACYDIAYKEVVAVLSAQSGKSEGFYNVMGHRLDDDPVPVLYIGPTQKYVESVSN